MERSREIFGNRMKDSVYRKAVNSKRKFQKKFGDDSRADYQVNLRENPYIGSRLGVWNVELGEGTLECRDIAHTLQMLELFLEDENYLGGMCGAILRNRQAGIYDGAYRVVELAMGLKENSWTK